MVVVLDVVVVVGVVVVVVLVVLDVVVVDVVVVVVDVVVVVGVVVVVVDELVVVGVVVVVGAGGGGCTQPATRTATEKGTAARIALLYRDRIALIALPLCRTARVADPVPGILPGDGGHCPSLVLGAASGARSLRHHTAVQSTSCMRAVTPFRRR